MQHHAAFMQYLALQKGLQSEHCYWIYYESLNFFVSLVHSRETTNILFRKTVPNKSCHQEERIWNFGIWSQSNSAGPGPYTYSKLCGCNSPRLLFSSLKSLQCYKDSSVSSQTLYSHPLPPKAYLRLAYFLIIC